MEFIRDEARAILETAIAEKTNLLDLRDKEISSLKQSIETLKRSAEVKQRIWRQVGEEKSGTSSNWWHYKLVWRLQRDAKYYADAEARAKHRVEATKLKRIIEEATLRETNTKNTSQQKAQREQNLSKRASRNRSSTSTNGIACFNNRRKEEKEEEEEEEEEKEEKKKKKMMTRKLNLLHPSRSERRRKLAQKVAEARKNAKSAANKSPANFNGGKSPNARKIWNKRARRASIVKRAIEAQKRVEKPPRFEQSKRESKRLFH